MMSADNRERAKQRVIDAYKRTRRIKTAAEAGPVPYSTANVWLAEAGLVLTGKVLPSEFDRYSRGRGPSARINEAALARVDRDPCPRCNTRKDIGCKHFPKQPEAARPMTDRERAEAMWSKSV